METIGDNIYVNIKELPSIDEVQPGDYLIVETDTGTNIIDFTNVVLPPENVTFYGDIEDLQSDVFALSSAIDDNTTTINTISAVLGTSVTSAVTSVTTQITTLSNTYTDWFIKGSITFNGTVPDVSAGVRCNANRISTGVYQIAFPNVNINACFVSSNADKAIVAAVTNSSGGGIAIINTYIVVPNAPYQPVLSDVSLISVVGV
jgi:hypothetical protein